MKRRRTCVTLSLLLAATLAEPLRAGEEAQDLGYLGISLSGIATETRVGHGLKEGQTGLLVQEVAEGGPAATAGLKTGDVLLCVEGTPVTDPEQATKLIQKLKPGGEAKLTLLRDGKEQILAVIPGAASKVHPQSQQTQTLSPSEIREKAATLREKLSALREKSGELKKRYGGEGLSENEMDEIDRRISKELQPEIDEIRRLREELQAASRPPPPEEPESP